MKNITATVILGLISLICYVLSILQFCEKGLLLNNSYLYATKQEKKSINKKPYYKQSGVIFCLLGIVFTINAIEVNLQTNWLFYCVIGIVIVIIAFAIISTILIKKREKTK